MTNTATKSSVMKSALILVLGAFVAMLDTTMTNIGINTILNDLHSTVNTMQWVTTAYVLALGLTVAFAGWLIDAFSGKKIQIFALVIFLAGSILSGAANSIPILLIGRIVQGIGGGILMSAVSTLSVRLTGGQGLGKMMAVLGLPVLFAPVLGPTVGGFLIKYWSWHWLFYINVPIIAVALAMSLLFLPAFEPISKGKPFDLTGFVLISLIFSGIIISITNYSADNLFESWKVLLPAFVGLDSLIGYIIYAFKQPNKALLSIKLFSHKTFSASTILLFISGLMVNGMMFVLPLYLQNIQHLSVIETGIYLIAHGAGMLVSRALAGRLTDRYGAKWIVMSSLLISAIATVPFAFFTAKTSVWLILATLFFLGISRSGVTIPIMADSYTGLPQELISQATVATRMAQNIGGALATAFLASVIQSQIGDSIPTTTLLNTAYSHAFVWTIIGTLIAVIPAFYLSVRSGKEQA